MDDSDALPATSTEITNQSSSAPSKDLLSIPATSAASESAFSVGKDVFGISRMSLKPETNLAPKVSPKGIFMTSEDSYYGVRA
ncbi:hypothetical protein DAPPUDRAFT_257316 [Daphnia pulex]|uniref:HAT C-terminal dimerisation domain-containing protein n=1 Tax=Daphnia pulex TaxID=6669 RepID=E9HDB7_DAPPU|nr:hypothetical protein DAPPUDRAFT_257316 [Daphnia pulex]|eukprot:EFX70276.1 hypothetical protein DAPPUDRAFT_257316 [Daphnia pulex]